MVGAVHAVTEIGILIVLMMLACPLVMGAMMLLMWRGMRRRNGREGRRAGDTTNDAV